MSLLAVLTEAIAAPLAKFLLKGYLKDPGGDVGAELVDLAARRITDYGQQREAQRAFEGIADRVVNRLMPLFERAEQRGGIVVVAVARELGQTLGAHISAEFLVGNDLNPARLAAEFRRARALPPNQFSADETALYERALDESVRYLVEVATRLPGFDVSVTAQSLQRLSNIGRDIDEVLDIVQRIEARVSSDDAIGKIERFEADYRQAVIRNLDFLELFGAEIRPESRRHALSVAYISLNVETQSKGRDEIESVPADALLDRLSAGKPRLLIRGEAGSGKSTFLRWIAIQAAMHAHTTLLPMALSADLPHSRGLDRKNALDGLSELADALGSLEQSFPFPSSRLLDALQSPAPSWRMRIPLVVRLRDLTRGNLPPPKDLPELVARELGEPPERWVMSLLENGNALVLLDGVDEVPNVHRPALKRAIEAIVSQYPTCFYVLSTRPAAVEEGWLTGLDFREARINPMAAHDRDEFIDKWHTAITRELERAGRNTDGLEQLAAKLKNELRENPAIARLATNPLLAAMICALHRDTNAKLPESQAALCEALCKILLHQRERESGLVLAEFPKPYPDLSYEQKRVIVREIAHYMVRNGESTVSTQQADQTIAEVLTALIAAGPDDAKIVRRGLIERSGLLRESLPGQVDFIHNTFKEYLAAGQFVEGRDYGALTEHIKDPAWQPVLMFAAATDNREFAKELIQKLLRGQSRERLVFAVVCFANALWKDAGLRDKITAIEKSLFPPKSMAEAEALAVIGEAVAPYLKPRRRVSAREAAACVRALRLIGSERAMTLLREYREDPRITVAAELAQAINPLELRAVRDRLMTGKSVPLSVLRYASDLTPLTKLTGLRKLQFATTRALDLTPLAALTSLESLDLECQRVNLTPLSTLSGLKSLKLVGLFTDLTPLAALTGLQSLTLASPLSTDLTPLAGLTNLRDLELFGTRHTDMTPLAALTALHYLALYMAPTADLTLLAGMTELRTLFLTGRSSCRLPSLDKLTNLRYLALAGTSVSDLTALAGLSGLRSLIVDDASIVDLSPLAGLQQLQYLDVRRTAVTDTSVLHILPNLRIVR